MWRFIATFIAILITIHSICQSKIIHIPNDKINDMKIDGYLNDWSWVPESYHLKLGMCRNLVGPSSVDSNNFYSKIVAGWSELTNSIYVAAIVYDDEVNYEFDQRRFWENDVLDVVIGTPELIGLHNGEFLYPKHDSLHNYFRFRIGYSPADNKTILGLRLSDTDWRGEHINYKCSYSIDSDGQNITIYEICLPFWETYNQFGRQICKKSHLEPYQDIHLDIILFDKDFSKNASVNPWLPPTVNTWWLNENNMPNHIFTLAPAIKPENNWNSIQELLIPIDLIRNLE